MCGWGGAIAGAIRHSIGKYEDCVFDGVGVWLPGEFRMGTDGAQRPIDLGTWAFYRLPVLRKSGYLIGDKIDSELNTSLFKIPFQGPSFSQITKLRARP